MPGRDTKQIDSVAAEFGMDQAQRFGFGKYIEGCKDGGDYGSGRRGDFTSAELREKAAEFLGGKR